MATHIPSHRPTGSSSDATPTFGGPSFHTKPLNQSNPSQYSNPGLGQSFPTSGQTPSHTKVPSYAGSFSESGTIPQRPAPRKPPQTMDRDRSDALWAEMQATLEEVELSASGGTHIFGAEHDRKLAELRAEQISLAQAWARSEADEVIDTKAEKDPKAPVSVIGDSTREGDGSKSIGSGPQPTTASVVTTETTKPKVQSGAEVDMLLARKRREANDIYFDRVNQGVIDVVAKLGDVAAAMSAVERESRSVWNGDDSSNEPR